MSYILDALKRADAERASALAGNAAPRRPVPQPLAAAGPQGAWKRPVLLALGVLLLGVLLTLGWRLRPGAEPRAPLPLPLPRALPAAAPPSPGLAAQPPAAVAEPSPPSTPGGALPAATSTGPDGAGQPARLMGPPQPSARVLASASPPFEGRAPLPPRPTPAAEPPVTSGDTAQAASEAAPMMAPGAAPAPAGGPGPVAIPAPQVPAMPGPLPATPSLPAAPSAPQAPPQSADGSVKVSGASYSANPEHRLLIVNGKVVKEGQEVEPGLVLEVITPRSAVFNRRGTRFNVNY